MTTPIPRSARPVVWFIRWWVKKPRTLPRPDSTDLKELRWRKVKLSQRCCPLGLCPAAIVGNPAFPYSAGLTESELEDYAEVLTAFESFISWWDSQTDARAAVDAVWGKG